MNAIGSTPPTRIKLTEQVIRSMRLACRKHTYQVGGTEYRTERAHADTDPHCWWYSNEHWFLSIRCRHNAHGEYYLSLSPASLAKPDPDEWHCFLQDGRWGRRFLHLRHIVYFDELATIVSALTDLKLCLTETEAKAYLDQHPNPGTPSVPSVP